MNDDLNHKMLKKLEPVFREVFLNDGLCISEETSPASIEEWDSLAHVFLLAEVEKAFDVRFSAEDMGNIGDVSSLLTKLRELGAS